MGKRETNVILGMCRSSLVPLIRATVASTLATVLMSAAPAASSSPSIVLELFTSQGCASCPDANRIVARLADKPGMLALTYAVDYWDYLGWKDTLAKPEFTARQRAYDSIFKRGEVYTPAVVVMGREDAPGIDLNALEDASARAVRAQKRHPGPIIKLDTNAKRVWIGSGHPSVADIWLVRFDPAERTVRITDGENKGLNVVHRNAVTAISLLGTWTGKPVRFTLPADASKGTAILVQGRDGGPIVAAAARVAGK